LVREEVEMPITKEEFDQHRFQVEHHFLEKTRYTLPYNTVFIELDIYKNLQ
jgi:CYTH domain-containing protein